jgi:hypothetical protein
VETKYKNRNLVLCNLKEANIKSKETHPDIAISFSRFSEQRPKQSIQAGAHGRHTTYVYNSSDYETYDRCSMSGGNDWYVCV